MGTIYPFVANLAYRIYPNKRTGRLLTHHPRQGGAYLGQNTLLLYNNAYIDQKGGPYSGGGAYSEGRRLFG